MPADHVLFVYLFVSLLYYMYYVYLWCTLLFKLSLQAYILCTLLPSVYDYTMPTCYVFYYFIYLYSTPTIITPPLPLPA